jgi:hypothetical protein
LSVVELRRWTCRLAGLPCRLLPRCRKAGHSYCRG